MHGSQQKYCCLILATICVSNILTVNALKPEERDYFLNYHNQARQNVTPPAKNMKPMKYNLTLESIAQKWADRCVFEHPPPSNREFKPFGQNIGVTGNQFGKKAIMKVQRMWHDERRNYKYKENQCTKVCGHYTQMVWHNSDQLGCATKQCDNIFPGMNSTFVVCQYYLRGNYIGQRPYERAPKTDQEPEPTPIPDPIPAREPALQQPQQPSWQPEVPQQPQQPRRIEITPGQGN